MRANRSIESYGLAGQRRNPYKEACFAVERFNQAHTIGTPVRLLEDGGAPAKTHYTATTAQVVDGHIPAVWLRGFNHSFPLESLEVLR